MFVKHISGLCYCQRRLDHLWKWTGFIQVNSLQCFDSTLWQSSAHPQGWFVTHGNELWVVHFTL